MLQLIVPKNLAFTQYVEDFGTIANRKATKPNQDGRGAFQSDRQVHFFGDIIVPTPWHNKRPRKERKPYS